MNTLNRGLILIVIYGWERNDICKKYLCNEIFILKKIELLEVNLILYLSVHNMQRPT